ncbi:uncharacterized protein LOC142348753 isoform X1 [Convolutriloba macropyga]|uniref:uncharacterized protein LOC142348753 isoform X1 n=1 Tax=Convolutriloba macropyga TaxID=536237 RepID=UPI003F523935
MSFEFVKYLEEKLNQTPLEPHVKQMFQLFIIDLQDKNWQIQALKNELSSIQRAQKAAQIREGIARHIFNEQAKNVLSDITDPKSDNPVSQCRQKKQRMSGQSDSCDLQLTLCEIDTYRRNTSEHIGYNEEVVSFSLVDSSPAGSLKHSSSAGELSRSLRSESEVSLLERGIGGERVRGRKRSFFGHGFGFHIPLDVAGVESSEVEVETSLVSVPLIPLVN